MGWEVGRVSGRALGSLEVGGRECTLAEKPLEWGLQMPDLGLRGCCGVYVQQKGLQGMWAQFWEEDTEQRLRGRVWTLNVLRVEREVS